MFVFEKRVDVSIVERDIVGEISCEVRRWSETASDEEVGSFRVDVARGSVTPVLV